MAKASKKYKAWREKHGYPIGPSSKKTKDTPTISFPGKHKFKDVKPKSKK